MSENRRLEASVVWKLDMAGDGRSEEREGVAGERREMLWVMLRGER
jgi:hypothetical protein